MLKPQTNVIIIVLIKLSFCSSPMEPNIIGGEKAKIEQFPHSVFLVVQGDKPQGEISWTCGASVLNQRIMLTAAHCLFGCGEMDRVDIFAGNSNILATKIVRPVIRFITHADYNKPVEVDNDIGLAMIKNDLPLGKSIKRVSIRNIYPFDLLNAQVAGWGMVNEKTGAFKSYLKYLKQTVQSREICGSLGILHAGMFCAGSKEDASQRPAEGDSGSALIVSSYTQIGLVSFNIDDYPALMVYSNVTYYLPWIRHMSQVLYCCCKDNRQCIEVDGLQPPNLIQLRVRY